MKTKTPSLFIVLTTISVALLATSAQAQFQWAKRIASNTNPDGEFSIGMALDTNANCYVTGWFDGTNDFGGVTLTNLAVGGQDVFVAALLVAALPRSAWAQFTYITNNGTITITHSSNFLRASMETILPWQTWRLTLPGSTD
ncbi:MAG TPA: hypothetical protein VKA67_05645 [Verrucomicrobiae bacterium]|nr:hypothetical protein [Verrucomicrobiae bacterium]